MRQRQTREVPSEDPEATAQNEDNLKAYMDKKVIPPMYDRPALMQYIQRLSIDAAVRGDYDAADKYSELNRKFYDDCIELEGEERVKMQLEECEEKMSVACNELSEVEKKWVEILKEVRRLEDDKMKQLLETQKEELAELDAKWKSEEALRPFAKQSPQLLALRVKEKNMLLARMFKEAEVLGKHCDELEQQETRDAQSRAEKEAVFQRTQLMAKHAKEIEQTEIKAQRRYDVLLKKRDDELEIARHRISKVELNKSLVGRSRKHDTESAVKMRERSSDTSGKLSPRSQMKLEAYRKKTTTEQLEVKPVTDIPTKKTRTLRQPKHA